MRDFLSEAIKLINNEHPTTSSLGRQLGLPLNQFKMLISSLEYNELASQQTFGAVGKRLYWVLTDEGQKRLAYIKHMEEHEF